MKIRKVLLKPNGIEIHYEALSDTGSVELHAVKSTDAALPEFYASLERLKEHLLNTLDLPEQWGRSGLSITGLTATENEGLLEFSILAEKSVRWFDKPAKFSTPKGSFTGRAAEDLETACLSAQDFVLGNRAQLGIPFVSQSAAETKKGGMPLLKKIESEIHSERIH